MHSVQMLKLFIVFLVYCSLFGKYFYQPRVKLHSVFMFVTVNVISILYENHGNFLFYRVEL